MERGAMLCGNLPELRQNANGDGDENHVYFIFGGGEGGRLAAEERTCAGVARSAFLLQFEEIGCFRVPVEAMTAVGGGGGGGNVASKTAIFFNLRDKKRVKIVPGTVEDRQLQAAGGGRCTFAKKKKYPSRNRALVKSSHFHAPTNHGKGSERIGNELNNCSVNLKLRLAVKSRYLSRILNARSRVKLEEETEEGGDADAVRYSCKK